MSGERHQAPAATEEPAPAGTSVPAEQERPLDDVPPVAGGTDDTPPAQGEGESDSW